MHRMIAMISAGTKICILRDIICQDIYYIIFVLIIGNYMSVPFYISFIVIMGYNHMSFVGITEDIFNEKDGYNLL